MVVSMEMIEIVLYRFYAFQSKENGVEGFFVV